MEWGACTSLSSVKQVSISSQWVYPRRLRLTRQPRPHTSLNCSVRRIYVLPPLLSLCCTSCGAGSYLVGHGPLGCSTLDGNSIDHINLKHRHSEICSCSCFIDIAHPQLSVHPRRISFYSHLLGMPCFNLCHMTSTSRSRALLTTSLYLTFQI